MEIQGLTVAAASALHSMSFQKKEFSLENTPVSEEYDLVIVGAGISGLAAAYFYRQRFGNDKSILILDALDDIGGHAKRNEFQLDGKTVLGYGGSESLQSPNANFSDTMHRLLKDLKVDLKKFETDYFQHQLYPGLGLTKGEVHAFNLFMYNRIVLQC